MSETKSGAAGVMKAVAEGSGRLVKTAKLSINLSSEESKLKAIYLDIGKSVHEIYKHGGGLGEIFDAKYQQILESEAKISDIKSRIEVAKGIVTCPKCETNTKRGSAFCPKCGENLSGEEIVQDFSPPIIEEVILEAVPQTQVAPQNIGKICNLCSYENDATERYCLSCGRVL
ncbi:MAG: zinc ribbon domain-containing protein [Defluviitaleaceae bacterium]|nr:zinc ribbon domain-containing protein [Defluviitaleaceae bacterium]